MVPGADLENQELRIALETLRRENAELRKAGNQSQRELAAAASRLSLAEQQLKEKRRGLSAMDDDGRSAEEWKASLLRSLKALDDASRETQAAAERLKLLYIASKEALKSAERIEPAKRAMLEAELRLCEKALAGWEQKRPVVLPKGADASALKAVKIFAVDLDLGVAALAVGMKQGAKAGMPFVVVRDKLLIATLTLVEVRETASLAIVEQMEPKNPIRAGDTAMLRQF
ncbi:MAG: hypothetical protein PHV34_04445 [Verrucomicrobiae bacterium]|nr:hypothetical protein [Verrucomicrobiae bacterium]